MVDKIIYEAAVYSRNISYRNFKGEELEQEVFFSLDPLKLMAFIARFDFGGKKSRSGNPAVRAQEEEPTVEDQLNFVREIACLSAGFPSEDGYRFDPFEDFEKTIVGRAFLTKLAASDADRKEFAELVILDPFRAFVGFAKADPSNDQAEIKSYEEMVTKMQNVLLGKSEETLAQRKARLEAEMAELRDSQLSPQE